MTFIPRESQSSKIVANPTFINDNKQIAEQTSTRKYFGLDGQETLSESKGLCYYNKDNYFIKFSTTGAGLLDPYNTDRLNSKTMWDVEKFQRVGKLAFWEYVKYLQTRNMARYHAANRYILSGD
jgi:hypothetical protein